MSDFTCAKCGKLDYSVLSELAWQKSVGLPGYCASCLFGPVNEDDSTVAEQ